MQSFSFFSFLQLSNTPSAPAEFQAECATRRDIGQICMFWKQVHRLFRKILIGFYLLLSSAGNAKSRHKRFLLVWSEATDKYQKHLKLCDSTN
jgi:hypothetical protein